MYRVNVSWTGIGGSPYYTRFHFDDEGEAQPSSMHAGVAAFLTAIRGYWAPPLQAVVQPQVEQVDVATGETQAAISIPQVTISSSSTASAGPKASQANVRLYCGTYVRGRQVQGRIYIPYVPILAYDAAGNLQQSSANAITTASENLRTAQGGGFLLGWGVYSPPRELAPLITRPGAFHIISSTSCSTVPAVLRSRRD